MGDGNKIIERSLNLRSGFFSCEAKLMFGTSYVDNAGTCLVFVIVGSVVEWRELFV